MLFKLSSCCRVGLMRRVCLLSLVLLCLAMCASPSRELKSQNTYTEAVLSSKKAQIWSEAKSVRWLRDALRNKPLEMSLPIGRRKAPRPLLKCLRVLTVPFRTAGGEVKAGELVVNADIAIRTAAVFEDLLEVSGFYIERIEGLSKYAWSDDRSMADNNSSAWNYRSKASSQNLSWHGLGLAIDINPRSNPYVTRSGRMYPPNSQGYWPRDDNPRVFDPMSVTGEVIEVFEEHGFAWGGDWRSSKDYQHFEIIPAGYSAGGSPPTHRYCGFEY